MTISFLHVILLFSFNKTHFACNVRLLLVGFHPDILLFPQSPFSVSQQMASLLFCWFFSFLINTVSYFSPFFLSSTLLIPRELFSSRISYMQLLGLTGIFWSLLSINVELLRCMRSPSITFLLFIY